VCVCVCLGVFVCVIWQYKSHLFIQCFVYSQLNLYENTNISFLNNSASESGGAIYVDFPPIRFVIDIFNRLCFMQFVNERNNTDLPPQHWAVSMLLLFPVLSTLFDVIFPFAGCVGQVYR